MKIALVYQPLEPLSPTGTANIIALCRKYQVKRLVYTSSVHAIPAPKGAEIREVSHFDPRGGVSVFVQLQGVKQTFARTVGLLFIRAAAFPDPPNPDAGIVRRLALRMQYCERRWASGGSVS